MERDLRINNSCGDEGDVKADADPIRDNVTANVDRDAALLEVRIRSRGREEHMLFVMTRIVYSARRIQIPNKQNQTKRAGSLPPGKSREARSAYL